MTDSKIAINIVSRNDKLARLLSLELYRMELPCSVSRTPLKNFTAYILDCDSVSPTHLSNNTLLITESPEKLSPSLLTRTLGVMEIPFSMYAFRKAIRDHFVSVDTDPLENRSKKKPNLRIYKKQRAVSVDGSLPISLTPSEFLLLCELQNRKGQPLYKEEANALLGSECNSNLYEVHICSLRKKLAAHTDKKWIYTLRNQGYYMK